MGLLTLQLYNLDGIWISLLKYTVQKEEENWLQSFRNSFELMELNASLNLPPLCRHSQACAAAGRQLYECSVTQVHPSSPALVWTDNCQWKEAMDALPVHTSPGSSYLVVQEPLQTEPFFGLNQTPGLFAHLNHAAVLLRGVLQTPQ